MKMFTALYNMVRPWENGAHGISVGKRGNYEAGYS
jgi:hypothetical protein